MSAAELRAAAAKRDAAAGRLRDLESRAAILATEIDAADRAAEAAATTFRDALGAAASGEAVDTATARASRDATAARLDELIETSRALESRVEAARTEHVAAVREAARRRQAVAMSIAGQREADLRVAAEAFAQAKRAWHSAAQAAADAAYQASGMVGVEPIVHTGYRPSMLANGVDEGLLGVFARAGLAENLTPRGIRGMTEAELLADDE